MVRQHHADWPDSLGGMKHSGTRLDPLAESAVIAACALADASGLERWSAGAIEDAATALEVLAGALSSLSPAAAEILEVVPAAVAALREGVERVPTAAAPSGNDSRAGDPAVLSAGLRRALATHNLTGRVHQLGPDLLTAPWTRLTPRLSPRSSSSVVNYHVRHPPLKTNPAGARGRPMNPSRRPWPLTGRGRTPGSSLPGTSPAVSLRGCTPGDRCPEAPRRPAPPRRPGRDAEGSGTGGRHRRELKGAGRYWHQAVRSVSRSRGACTSAHLPARYSTCAAVPWLFTSRHERARPHPDPDPRWSRSYEGPESTRQQGKDHFTWWRSRLRKSGGALPAVLSWCERGASQARGCRGRRRRRSRCRA